MTKETEAEKAGWTPGPHRFAAYTTDMLKRDVLWNGTKQAPQVVAMKCAEIARREAKATGAQS